MQELREAGRLAVAQWKEKQRIADGIKGAPWGALGDVPDPLAPNGA